MAPKTQDVQFHGQLSCRQGYLLGSAACFVFVGILIDVAKKHVSETGNCLHTAKCLE